MLNTINPSSAVAVNRTTPGNKINTGTGSNVGNTLGLSKGKSVLNTVGASGYTGGSSSLIDQIANQSQQNNLFNLEQVAMNNQFNSAEAQKNRDFQERMSNTAHQREVKDLIAAGLNPVLSALNGNGASTPSGSYAQGTHTEADTSLSNGLISLMSSLINASSAMSVASIYANASMYTADKNYAASVGNNFRSSAVSEYVAQLYNNTMRGNKKLDLQYANFNEMMKLLNPMNMFNIFGS